MNRSSPFALIAFALAAGIWLASQFALPIWLSALAAGLALLVGIAVRKQPIQVWSAGCVMLFALGCLYYTAVAPTPTASSTAPYNGRAVVLEGEIGEEPDVRPEYSYLRVRVRRLAVDGTHASTGGVVLVRADKAIRWRYGDVIRAVGTLEAPPILSAFDYRGYLARKGIFSWMSQPERVQRTGEGQGSPLYAALLSVRAALRLSSQQVMPSPESALLNGILIGDDNEIPPYIQDAFRRTGTSHIVSISGFNVSVVIALVAPALSRLLNKRRAALVAIPAIIVYTLLVGASPSVVRAATMAIIALFGQLCWRRGFTLNTLCAAAFFMLLLDPETLFDGGFQLSFAATLGLVLYDDRIDATVQKWLERHFTRARARKLTSVLAGLLLVTLSAQVTTLPLILANFQQLSLITLVTNALVLPLQPAAMILGIVASAAGVISVPLGSVIALPAYALLTTTLRLVEWTGALPWAAIPIYDVGAPAAVAYYLGLFALTAVIGQPAGARNALKSALRARAGAALFVAAIVAIIGAVYWYQRPDGKLHVTFSGAGAFIQTPSGRQVIFAGGGGILPVMGRAMPLWDKGVELIVLPRRNDLARNDALPILQRYKVGTVIHPAGRDKPSAALDEWTDLAQTRAGRVITVPTGTRAIVEPGVLLTIEQRTMGNIGARLSYGNATFELAGDAAVISGTLGNADVVFVSVRGGRPDALNAAQPRWVVWADAGGAPDSLSGNIRAVALRDAGMIEFVSDGKTLVVAER